MYSGCSHVDRVTVLEFYKKVGVSVVSYSSTWVCSKKCKNVSTSVRTET